MENGMQEAPTSRSVNLSQSPRRELLLHLAVVGEPLLSKALSPPSSTVRRWPSKLLAESPSFSKARPLLMLPLFPCDCGTVGLLHIPLWSGRGFRKARKWNFCSAVSVCGQEWRILQCAGPAPVPPPCSRCWVGLGPPGRLLADMYYYSSQQARWLEGRISAQWHFAYSPLLRLKCVFGAWSRLWSQGA